MQFKMAPWTHFIPLVTYSLILMMLYTVVQVSIFSITRDFTDIFIVSVVIVLLLIFYVLGPREFEIQTKEITIKRIVSNITIPFKSIQSVELVYNVKLTRTLGNGGLFSYYGRYMDTDGSVVKVYATRFDCMVNTTTNTASSTSFSYEKNRRRHYDVTDNEQSSILALALWEVVSTKLGYTESLAL